ncbi:MAG TPA: flagellar hook basal-body protein [Anaerohalosphaeraceae bacterium]|nr:flagellar hook basal-body protein [Phycisphaerae bacterium]HOK95027.1 flagellar hook basal-body protein [Anaerohalosphaeraceae bacterium]HOL30338.1 flagellar hook basal-body protein [Anaerohalosphaeraceae bacterium]HOM75404.1 flagellar hook basal-body protein [Anaerohalosphaeraceae bacterium]HPC63036.1 flagellar hook basal-body protein [Anaerohalosphaeraceae bacterium]
MSEISAQVGSAIRSLTQEFDLIAHNLANVSTPGFKRRYNDFSKSLSALEQTAGPAENSRKPANIAVDFTQGSFIETGRTLDMALCGKGFFVIETPQGPLYTRNGAFRLNENGQIVDMIGRIVAGESGPITVPQAAGLSQINVAADGTVSAAGVPIGKFKLVDFLDKENRLTPAGLNCFAAPQNMDSEPAVGLVVKQGFQESSNVQLTEELVDMIMVSRLYEANMKLISKSGETAKNLLDVAMS